MQDSRAAYTLQHNRPQCIGCTACAALNPEFWTMNEEDGLSDIVGGKMGENGWEELEIAEADFEKNLRAAEVCPVNVIHLIKIGSREPII